MGEMSSYYVEQEMGLEFYGPTEDVWVTREGTRIAVFNMSDSHLVNTIRFLQRKHRERVDEISDMIVNAPTDSALDWACEREAGSGL